jgi:hypothetical protein
VNAPGVLRTPRSEFAEAQRPLKPAEVAGVLASNAFYLVALKFGGWI